jgi:GntR family transcriptional regulator
MFKMPQIDRSSSLSLYYQLYLILKELIERDRFKEGDVFYSENELQQMFKVSRITVRKALDMLETNGYIHRSQGSNSIVQNRAKGKLWWNLLDFTEDLKKEGQKVTSQIIRIEKIAPTKKVASVLKLSKDDTFVYCIERVRKVDNAKITRSISHLVPWLPVDLTTIHFNSRTSIQKVLECMGQIFSYCDETIEAIIADKITCRYLDLEDNSPVFYRERITYNQDHVPIEFVTSYYNAKFCKYYVKDKIIL